MLAQEIAGRQNIHLGAAVAKVLGAVYATRRGTRLASETKLRATDIVVDVERNVEERIVGVYQSNVQLVAGEI